MEYFWLYLGVLIAWIFWTMSEIAQLSVRAVKTEKISGCPNSMGSFRKIFYPIFPENASSHHRDPLQKDALAFFEF